MKGRTSRTPRTTRHGTAGRAGGFSIIEILIGLSMTAVVTLALLQMTSLTAGAAGVLSRKGFTNDLVRLISHVATDDVSIRAMFLEPENVALRSCFQETSSASGVQTGQACSTDVPYPLKLVQGSRPIASGLPAHPRGILYSLEGRNCGSDAPTCPLEAKAWFLIQCPTRATTCRRPSGMRVVYSIEKRLDADTFLPFLEKNQTPVIAANGVLKETLSTPIAFCLQTCGGDYPTTQGRFQRPTGEIVALGTRCSGTLGTLAHGGGDEISVCSR